MSERGTYIVIEGNDGTGKSTQVEMLMSQLQGRGRDVVMVEEPGSEHADRSTPIANDLRSVIKNGNLQRDPEINLTLFSAARRELWDHMIAPALGRGAIVLSARNYLSTLVYQGMGEGLREDLILEKTRLYTDERYMSPDLLLVLTLEDEAERIARIDRRGALETPDTFESKSDDFQTRVNNGYVTLARERSIPTISCLDGTRSKTREEIQSEICQQPLIASLLHKA